MKLLRLKITDPKGFRSLPCGFEHHFRSEWTLRDELARPADFAPFVCAGPNGIRSSSLALYSIPISRGQKAEIQPIAVILLDTGCRQLLAE